MRSNRVVAFLPLLAAFVMPASALAGPPQATGSAVEKAVLDRNAQCNDAELRADTKMMDDCETVDFTHTHASGQVEYKTGYIQGVGSGSHKFLTLDMTDLHVRAYSGDSAIVEGKIHLRADNSGRIADVHNVFMTVWVKQEGKWREAAWIAVTEPQAKPQPAVSQPN